ncbi:MAG: type II toxin-antitoxin system VapC family toxin [Holophagales bacterium]|nr:type II toxin-antitoxin system VapC family toxin [Holophagales bacterium]
MNLLDVNVLVYAHREDVPERDRYRAWLESHINGDAAFGICDLVLSGFLRIVTHPKVFAAPSHLDQALDFSREVREAPACVVITPGRRHWGIFLGLCRGAGGRGNLNPDAYLAALAIESGSDWITTDRDFARFPGLRWRHPLG